MAFCRYSPGASSGISQSTRSKCPCNGTRRISGVWKSGMLSNLGSGFQFGGETSAATPHDHPQQSKLLLLGKSGKVLTFCRSSRLRTRPTPIRRIYCNLPRLSVKGVRPCRFDSKLPCQLFAGCSSWPPAPLRVPGPISLRAKLTNAQVHRKTSTIAGEGSLDRGHGR